MWIVRAAIEPMVWAFTCDKSKTGNCLPSGFTHDEEDAKKYKTYEGAVRAEMKLRKEKGLTHNQTETSGAKETTTMKSAELLNVMQQSGRLIVGHVGDNVPKGTIAYSLPAKRPVLKSRRFALVIDNELHIRKYEDPAHGWYAIPMQWLEAFGIVNDVSCCSYLKGGTAYLEEDCDAPLFRKAAEEHGYKLFIDHRHTNDRSAIRSYPSFN